MKLRLRSLIAIPFVILALVLGAVRFVSAAPASISVSGFSPNPIDADTPTVMTISGSGFDGGTQVAIASDTSRYTFSPSAWQPDQLTVTVQLPVGQYTVYAYNSPSDYASAGGLLVIDPSIPPTATPPFVRPQVAINYYKANVSAVTSGKEFRITLGFGNPGTADAYNVQAAFTSADMVPTQTGGVVVVGGIPVGGVVETSQTFLALDSLYGKSVVVVDVAVSYYDSAGTAYSDKFTLSIPASGGTGAVAATATPTGVHTAQLVVTGYSSTVDPLQPGDTFQLSMTVKNMGNSDAKNVTLIVGGGSAGGSGGTPEPGGVSGGSGEFTNFAPVGTSNIQSLGNLSTGGEMQVSQNLIVNVSTSPGAYPMKLTFSYVNDKGEVVNDDQVITLLVYGLPKADIGFYREPDPLFAGQTGSLPIQVVNLGKRTAVLGNMTLATNNGTLETETTLVGSLDPGGYFTFDGFITPDTAGPLQLTLTIEYTDDFNQPRTISKTLDLTVEEGFIDPSMEPGLEGGDGELPAPSEETFLQKIWRFILGLFGLDSAAPSDNVPLEGAPTEFPVPIMPGGGGGKGG
ncbi:MAG: COG1361 S-layer family protein [Chloroflexota bacterium]